MLRTNLRRSRRRRRSFWLVLVIVLTVIVAATLGFVLFGEKPEPWEAHVIPREEKALSVVWSYRPTKFDLPEGVDVEAPTWLYVEADSLGKPVLKNLNDMGYSGFNAPEYVTQAHDAGVEIWATVVSFDAELSRQVVADTQTRTEFAAALTQWVESSGVDGICFDFEYMDPADKDKYTALVQTAADALGDKTVAVAVTVPLGYEDESNWYQCYDREGLAEVADYLALMGYDAHKDSTQPVAPISWVRQALELTLSTIDSDKVLLGIPFYGVDFYGQKGETNQNAALSAVTMEKLLAEGRMGSDENAVVVDTWQNRGTWLEEWAVMEYEFTDTQGRSHTIWMECAESLQARGALMDEYALAGAAVWQKNQGTDALWTTLAEITAEKETETHE